MRVLDSDIVQTELHMEWFCGQLYDGVGCEEHRQAKVVAGIALPPEALDCIEQAAWLGRQPCLVPFDEAFRARHDVADE